MRRGKLCIAFLAAVFLCVGCGRKEAPADTKAENTKTEDTKKEDTKTENTKTENTKTEDTKSGKTENTEEADNTGDNSPHQEDPDVGKYPGTLALAEDIAALYRFELDGHTYQLPMPVAELEANGWKLTNVNPEDKTDGRTYVHAYMKTAEGNEISVTLVNLTEQEKQLKDCEIASVTAAGNLGELEFQTANGIALNSSTMEDVKKSYGTEKPVYASFNTTTSVSYAFCMAITEPSMTIIKANTQNTSEDEMRFSSEDKDHKVTSITMKFFGTVE